MRDRIDLLVMGAVAALGALSCTAAPPPPTATGPASSPRIEWGLVMHGGAGTIDPGDMTAETEQAYRATMERALRAGYAVLRDGGGSLDAVVAAIVILEDSPLFNAGRGAVFTAEGTNSHDASIMYGPTLEAGAVAGVGVVKNPIRLAREVMKASPHVMLSGEGAEQFADERGLELVDPAYFYTERRWRALQRAREAEGAAGGDAGAGSTAGTATGVGSATGAAPGSVSPGAAPFRLPSRFGTVGVIALDPQGRIAAGTSTGGMTNKKWGRIGDSPIIGAGTYAGENCGISSTGWGEYFIRNVVAFDICARMEYKHIPLEQAAHEVIMGRLESQEPETGGIVGLDGDGSVVMMFNTTGMYRGFIDADGRVSTAIYR
jgi:beta-aspartyl-peptidase (threonine type)